MRVPLMVQEFWLLVAGGATVGRGIAFLGGLCR